MSSFRTALVVLVEPPTCYPCLITDLINVITVGEYTTGCKIPSTVSYTVYFPSVTTSSAIPTSTSTSNGGSGGSGSSSSGSSSGGSSSGGSSSGGSTSNHTA
ncbi:hypothetical protein EDD21DRAFT_449315, partial [Dissophora ornata]